MHAHPDGQPHAPVLLQTGIQRPHGVENAQARPHRPLGVVFVRLGIAKVHQQAVAQVLGDIAVKALDHCGAGLLVGPHHLALVFRVELPGEAGRVDQVTEQHRELAAFGLGGITWGLGRAFPGRVGLLESRQRLGLGDLRGKS